MSEYARARIGTCRCGQQLIVTEPDERGNYRTHHGEPHCAWYQEATRGRREEIIPTVVVRVPPEVTISTKPGQA